MTGQTGHHHPAAAQHEVQEGIDPLLVGILQMLWEAPHPGWVSLPRLGKRLGSSGSEILRMLQVLSDAQFGDRQGLGWVEVRNDKLRWQARLTAAGRGDCAALFASATAPDPVQDALPQTHEGLPPAPGPGRHD